ncbi:MAG: hypothetical protein WKG07_24780 [Hymenobacter sp.]
MPDDAAAALALRSQEVDVYPQGTGPSVSAAPGLSEAARRELTLLHLALI